MSRLTIGILAHNEERVIARTIASLAGQSVLDPACARSVGLEQVEVLVVPNGCTDRTAAVARDALASLPPHIAGSVHALGEPGKANAWNRFVHELAPADADLLALMDADIEFGTADVLEQLVRRLRQDGSVDVALDRAVKDYRAKRLTLLNRFSRRVSREKDSGGTGLCGQLYCGRAEVLRRIWLPAGLPVEDGFIAAMLATDGFTLPAGREAIGQVAATWHYYEPLTGAAAFVRHEARLIVGSTINAWLFTLMWEAGRRGHAGDYVRTRNAADPGWVEAVCAEHRQRHGRWLVPRSFVLWRLASLRGQPWRRWLVRLPVAVAATLASLPAVWRANAILQRAAASRHW